MHRVAEQHGFVIANLVQQVLVLLDKGGLLVGIQDRGPAWCLGSSVAKGVIGEAISNSRVSIAK
jgi:hypothetical protein